MLKNYIWPGTILAVILCISMSGVVPALPVQAAQSSEKGSITVELDDIGTDRSDVDLECYLVGRMNDGANSGISWELTEEFEGAEVDLNQIDEADSQKTAAMELKKYADAHKEIKALRKETSDSEGQVFFDDLEQGIYLIVQTSGFSVYGEILPFLAVIPSMDAKGTKLIYDVKTQTKGERPADFDAPGDDSSSSSVARSGSARTGDDTRAAGFLILAVISAALVIWLLWRGFKKRKEE